MNKYCKLSREIEVIENLNLAIQEFRTKHKDSHPAYAYFEPIESLSEGLPVPIYGAMLLVWQLRDQDLQVLYPLDTSQNRLEFLCWCMTSGANEYQLIRECDGFWEALSKPAFNESDYPKQDASRALSWLMVLTLTTRPDLDFNLENSNGRDKLLLWYLSHGIFESKKNLFLEPWQLDFLLELLPSSINNHQNILLRSRSDLRKLFKIENIQDFKDWYSQSVEGKKLNSIKNDKVLTRKTEKESTISFGVNVVGYASEISGIAEDSRMMLSALSNTSIPTQIVDCSRNSLKQHPTENLHSINMFCFPVLEHARFLAERGLNWIVKRYNIGYWPWEISHWPGQWVHLFSLVDEVWSSSEYTRDSISLKSPVMVLYMPMAVEISPVRRKTRYDFSLPKEKFLFYFSYDFRSSSSRKNPMACVQAFTRAFPESDDVALVIKTLIPTDFNEQWEELKSLVSNDRRIYLISQSLMRSDLLDLYAVCDCFISLHRAEGFARNIAEAMLLKKPVIVTDYSGNCTFTNKKNSIAVSYTPSEINPGDYPHVNNGTWADPDINDAANAMIRISSSKSLSEKLVSEGTNTMFTYSSFSVASNYLSRIECIERELNKKEKS